MKIFLAGTASHEQIVTQHCPLYVLESYYYFKPWQIELIKKSEMFLLDSGAFTFLQNAKAHVDWDRYIENYAEFINQNNVKYFFELDIDAIVGYSKVVDFREKLERLTQKNVFRYGIEIEGIRNISVFANYMIILQLEVLQLKKSNRWNILFLHD